MSAAKDQKPLPFQYQFAAGAVAGVSEVSELQCHCVAATPGNGATELID